MVDIYWVALLVTVVSALHLVLRVLSFRAGVYWDEGGPGAGSPIAASRAVSDAGGEIARALIGAEDEESRLRTGRGRGRADGVGLPRLAAARAGISRVSPGGRGAHAPGEGGGLRRFSRLVPDLLVLVCLLVGLVLLGGTG
ncbi:hypothetical protein [Actinorugispora endophytica]|uniref:Uncharacterized protein n=1 Tax=Actinorugispora endophytica TaxID=1605990 RepID=A0A4R6UE66_9ACTN|nr:hypothetical protein [Actinorugispora endophytica]TDQ45038.1 hypothetical protein EV190_13330 [Actinorugispora endophytica]